MKAKILIRLNKRNFPSTTGNLPLSNPLEPGDIINVVEEVKGTLAEGTLNDRWFKTDKGYYVWSGGTDHVSMNERIVLTSNLSSVNWSDIASLDLIEEYIQINEKKLLKDYEADSVMATLKIKEGFHSDVPCLQFIVSKKGSVTATRVPDRLINSGGKIILTDILEERLPNGQSTVVGPGVKVFQSGSKEFGTLGFRARRKNGDSYQHFFVGCYHVFCDLQLKKEQYSIKHPNKDNLIFAEINGKKVEIGKVVEGIFSNTIPMDACIADISNIPQSTIHPPIYKSVPKVGIYNIGNGDVHKKTKVFGYGASTGSKLNGEIRGRNIKRSIKFNGSPIEFSEIIPTSKMSAPGDSGSVVFEKESGKIVGLLFAGGDELSYLIPISKILYNLNIEIDYENTI